MINVPQDAQDSLKGSMQDGVELPFPVCYFYVRNGNKQNKKQDDVSYFGGWATDFEKANAILDTVPDALEAKEFINQEGESYLNYTIRSLLVAPIAKRKRWDNEKRKSHMQVLCLVGMVEGGKFISLGAHVITAKGMQTKELETAFRDWETVSAQARKEYADNADAKFFYTGIGTYGKDPYFKEVGSVSKNFITPVVMADAGKLTAEKLEKRYVGDEIAIEMGEYYKQAQEWLADWQKKKEEKEVEPEAQPYDDTDLVNEPF